MFGNNYDSTVFVGLGYHHANNNTATTTTTSSQSLNTPATSTSSLVDSILQQCLTYHQEQEVIRQQQEQEEEFSYPIPEVQFVSATTKYDKESKQNARLPSSHYKIDQPNLNESQIKSDKDSSNDSKYNIEESLKRAQEIINRFHEQQNQLLPPVVSNNARTTTENDTRRNQPKDDDDDNDMNVADPEIYIQQRKIGFEREQKRIRLALLKNLEYIQKKDAEKIQQLQRQVHETSHYEQIAAQQYAIQIQKQKERILQATVSATVPITTAGIGTKERTKMDHKIHKERQRQSQQQQQQQQQSNNTTVAIYISGIPINENSSDVEDMIQRLFCFYGTIQKIHLYRDKIDKMKLKGDGLIIYNCSQEQGKQMELVQTVCSQMNGIELENGSILNVEPSNSNFQLQINNNNNKQVNPAPSLSAIGQIPKQSEITEYGQHGSNPRNANASNDNVDELDDFFDSLE